MDFKIIKPEKKLMRFFQGWDFVFVFVSFLPLFLLGIYLLFSRNIPASIESFSEIIGFFALLTSFLMIFGFFYSFRKLKTFGEKEEEIEAPLLFLLKVYVLTSVVPLLFIAIFTLLWIFPILIKEQKLLLLYIITILIGFTFLLSFFSFFSFRKKLFELFNFFRDENFVNRSIVESQIDFFNIKDYDILYEKATELYEKLFNPDFVSLLIKRGKIKTYNLNKDFVIKFLEKLGDGDEFNLELNEEYGKFFKDSKFLYVFKSDIKDGSFYVILGRKKNNFSSNEVGKMRVFSHYLSLHLRKIEYEDLQVNFFTHTVNLLVMSLEGNIVPKNHLQNVARYSNMISRELNMDEERRRRLYFAALLHDIGFLKIPVELQGIPEKYKLHPTLGAELVGEIEMWKDISEIIKYHHEAYDGSGYPEGLSGEDIPLESRIIAVAESFDALTNEYSYKSIVDENYALSDIESKAGKKYDPQVVEAFIRCFREKSNEE